MSSRVIRFGGPRLIACDVDGTLIAGGSDVPVRVRQAITTLRRSGVQLVLATGRSPWAIRRICETLELGGPQITMQGALIASPLTGEVLAAALISHEDVCEQIAFAESSGLGWVVCHASGYRIGRLTLEIEEFFSLGSVERGRVEVVASATEAAADDSVRTLLFAPRGRHDVIRRAVEERFGRRFATTWGDTRAVELLAHGVSKGSALRSLAAHLGINMAEVAAMGNGRNDLEMLAAAGNAVAMDSAPAEVKAVATKVGNASAKEPAYQALSLLFPTLLEMAPFAEGPK